MVAAKWPPSATTLWRWRSKRATDSQQVSPPKQSLSLVVRDGDADADADAVHESQIGSSATSLLTATTVVNSWPGDREMGITIYADTAKAAEELANAFENLAEAARNFAYTYETLPGARNLGRGDVPPDPAQDCAGAVEFARTLSENTRTLAESLQSCFAAPLKNDYDTCCDTANFTVQEIAKKMTALVKEMRALERRTSKERKKKNRDTAKLERNVQQLRRMGAEVAALRIEKDAKMDELARASLPYIFNSCQAGASTIAEHYLLLGDYVTKFTGDFRLGKQSNSKATPT